MLPWLWKFKHQLHRNAIRYIILVGLAGTAVPAVLFPIAQQYVDSSSAGMLNALTPLFTFILGVLFYKLQYSILRLSGVLTGMVGAIILILAKHRWTIDAVDPHAIYILLATMCYALSVNTVNTHLQKVNSGLITSFSLFVIAIPASLILFRTDLAAVLTHPDAMISLAAVAILAVFGTALASILFFYLVQKTDAVFGSSVAFLIPIVALLLGLWDGELFNIGVLIGLILILTGVYLSKNKQNHQ